jgi:hypothetical protein
VRRWNAHIEAEQGGADPERRADQAAAQMATERPQSNVTQLSRAKA